MVRTACTGLAGLLLLTTAAAAADAPAGTWKFTFYTKDQQGAFRPQTPWLFKLDQADGKWTVKVVSTAEGVPETTIENVKVADGQVRFTIKIPGRELNFEGKVGSAKAEKMLGSLDFGRNAIFTAELEATDQTDLMDEFAKNKEILTRKPDSPEAFDAAVSLLGDAASKKVKPEEVRGWADKAYKAAEAYGPRWQREIGARITSALVNQEGFAPVALEYARRLERGLDPDEDAATQIRVLTLLSQALTKADKADEAKEIQARLGKLEAKADQEYLKKMPPYKTEAYAGRKDKSDRGVLVELFTGAQCPPCVAADLGFDGLEKTYKPSEVILLQYHLHIPGPDPLTNAQTVARADFYGDDIEGTPTIFFDGKPKAGGGGGMADSEGKYKSYCKVINPLLETAALAKIKANVARKGDKLDITAEVSDLALPGEKVKLRLALVEEQVRYLGGNGMRFHHHVVRALPGGVEGLALKEKTGKQTVSVDLGELRKELTKYLDGYAKERPFPNPSRPLDLKKLAVVAFVQNDATKEVYQAVQVEVPEN